MEAGVIAAAIYVPLRSGKKKIKRNSNVSVHCSHNGPELMTSVISFALSSHAMLTARTQINGCEECCMTYIRLAPEPFWLPTIKLRTGICWTF
jgi:hypothetical protein